MAEIRLKFVWQIKAKGKTYLWFNTGLRKPNGRPVLVRLPNAGSPDFGTKYAALLANRTKSANRKRLTAFNDMAHEYQLSPSFRNRAKGTQRTYMFYINRMVNMFGSFPASEIDRTDIRQLLEGLGPGAQKMQLNVAKIIFLFGIDKDLVTHNPADKMKIDHDAVPHEPWPESVIEAGLKGPQRLAIALLYFTGQRISDVCRMRWSDIQDGVITVIPQKTIKQRKELFIELHPRLAEILAEVPKSLTTIIATSRGKPLKPDALRLRIQQAVGSEYVPHGLRKNAVEALLECGCTLPEVASITGQTMQIIEHYAKGINNRKLAKKAIGKWGANK